MATTFYQKWKWTKVQVRSPPAGQKRDQKKQHRCVCVVCLIKLGFNFLIFFFCRPTPGCLKWLDAWSGCSPFPIQCTGITIPSSSTYHYYNYYYVQLTAADYTEPPMFYVTGTLCFEIFIVAKVFLSFGPKTFFILLLPGNMSVSVPLKYRLQVRSGL